MALARSGFKKPTPKKLAELNEKKRERQLSKLKEKKPRKSAPVARGGKSKLPTVKKMRDKCDKLLTPIIKKMYPTCIFTGEETQVAHHAIKKSTSSALRYYLPNLIPLTHKAHMRLHADEILWTGKLIELKGLEWWQDLMEKKEVYTKCDVHHYISEYARLQAILDSL